MLAAADGVEAVELFRKHRSEIQGVRCDVTMPRMNGWDTVTALRQRAPDFSIILASGYGEAQVMAGDLPERPQIFLHKPYAFKELGAAISQVMMCRKRRGGPGGHGRDQGKERTAENGVKRV